LLRIVAVLILTMVVSIDCFGQESDEAMIYCRDGSVYRGMIVSENSKTIRIVTIENDTLSVSQANVKKVKRSGDYLFHSKGKTHDINGFFWAINIGFNAAGMFTGEEIGSEHFELLFGWRFNKQWSVASGIGSEFNFNQIGGFSVQTNFSSFFLYGRYYFTDGRPRLFAYSRLGVGIGQSNETQTLDNAGGIQWQGGGGVHFASRKRARFIISLGYYMQKTNGTQFFLDGFGNEVKVDFDILITRPILKLGIEFG